MEKERYSDYLNRSHHSDNTWYPVLFKFHSECGSKLISLFQHLRKNHYHMALCSGDQKSGFICIAAREIPADDDLLMRLPVDMRILADQFDVRFDGLRKVKLKSKDRIEQG